MRCERTAVSLHMFEESGGGGAEGVVIIACVALASLFLMPPYLAVVEVFVCL